MKNQMKRHTGKCSIRFEYRDELTYPFGSYRTMGNRLEIYNVSFNTKTAHLAAAKLPKIFHDTLTVPAFQIKDENGRTLVDSKWDNLSNHLRV